MEPLGVAHDWLGRPGVRRRSVTALALGIVLLSAAFSSRALSAGRAGRAQTPVVYKMKRPDFGVRLIVEGHWVVYRHVWVTLACRSIAGIARWHAWYGMTTPGRMRISHGGRFSYMFRRAEGEDQEELLWGRVRNNLVQGGTRYWRLERREEGWPARECGTAVPGGRTLHYIAHRVHRRGLSRL